MVLQQGGGRGILIIQGSGHGWVPIRRQGYIIVCTNTTTSNVYASKISTNKNTLTAEIHISQPPIDKLAVALS